MSHISSLKRWFGSSVALATLLSSALATAATINVTTTADGAVPGTCSLRSAIQAANTNSAQQGCPAGSASGIDIIQVPTGVFSVGGGGTYWDEDNNQTGDLDVSGSVIIRGTDPRLTVIQAALRDRVFQVYSAASTVDVTIEKMTLVGGDVSANTSYVGGALYSAEILKLKDVVVRGGRALWAGNLYIDASATRTATLENVSVLDGYSTNSASGIYFTDTSTSLPPASNFRNVTISGNDGVAMYVDGKLGLHSSTITNNRRGGLLVRQSSGGSMWIANSIIAGNVGSNHEPDDVRCSGSGTFASAFYSLVGAVDTFFCAWQGQVDPVSGDPRLSPVFDFGAGIPVHALLPGSAAIGAGNPSTNGAWSNCLQTDARGVSRASFPCDIGAFEARFDISVNSTADLPDATPGNGICASIANTCTLRALFMEASASGGRWMASVPAGTYALTAPIAFVDGEGGDLDVKPVLGTPPLNLALFGPGDADAVQIVGGEDRVLDIRGKLLWDWGDEDDYRSIAFALLGATVRDGHLTEDPFQPPEESGTLLGGGVHINTARVLLSDVVVRDNVIEPDAEVYGTGAGISVDQYPIFVTSPDGNSQFLAYSSALHMERFAVIGNSGLGDTGFAGGVRIAVYAPGSTFKQDPSLLRNGTIAGNSAPSIGGLLAAGGGYNDVHVSHVTVTGNAATGSEPTALDGASLSAVVINNSILAGNAGTGHANDCATYSTVIGLGQVVTGSSAAECAMTGDTTGNLFDAEVEFGPLETFVNGMQGHRLPAGSPLLDWISLSYCWDTRQQINAADARGVARPGEVAPASTYCTPGAIEGDGYDTIFSDDFEP